MMVHMSLPDQRPAILDPSRILPEAREAGYSFVRVYDVVDTTNTEIVRRLTRGEPCERTELGELSVFTTLYMTGASPCWYWAAAADHKLPLADHACWAERA